MNHELKSPQSHSSTNVLEKATPCPHQWYWRSINAVAWHHPGFAKAIPEGHNAKRNEQFILIH
jgi:hypothetical protein